MGAEAPGGLTALTHRLGIRVALLLDVLSTCPKEAAMIFDREEAARRAEAATTNTPGTCQLWTRTIFGAVSAGDRDHDGDADAVDGWRSEPAAARHTDRNPPRGVPVAFSGGSRGFGHRAVSLGGGKIRSTDMTPTGFKAGVVGTTTIAQIEKSMGVRYLGWSETITGQPISLPEKVQPAPAPKPRPQAGPAVFSVAVCNTMAGSNASAAKGAGILRKTLEAYPKAVLVAVVEASNLLDANDAWKPTGDRRDLAKIQEGPLDKAGVALVYDRDRVEVLKVKYQLGARPFIRGRRIGMRNRLILKVKVRIDGRRARWVAVLHLPPPRFGPLWAPMAALVGRLGAYLGDFNKPPRAVAAATGKSARMSGVLGGLFPIWWRVGKARAADVGGDHDAVAITVHHRNHRRTK